jgi:hypothetical protein
MEEWETSVADRNAEELEDAQRLADDLERQLHAPASPEDEIQMPKARFQSLISLLNDLILFLGCLPNL